MHGALSHFVVARPRSVKHAGAEKQAVSVVIPVRNEAGNIDQILSGFPKRVEVTKIDAIGCDPIIVALPECFGPTQRIFDGLPQKPGESETEELCPKG